MSRVYDFLCDSGVFYVLTLNNNLPAGRPFGAVMEYSEKLYISTGTNKEVYNQLVSNPAIQILALKSGTRDWIRVNGKAYECKSLEMKQRMLQNCPILMKHFDSPACDKFALFEIIIKDAHLTLDNEIVQIYESED